MDHPFYAMPPLRQRRLQWIVVLLLLAILLLLVSLAYLFTAYWVLLFLFLPLQVAAPFLDMPAGKKSGKLVYYAPLFVVEPRRRGPVILHGGTLLDYVFVLRKLPSSHQRRQRVWHDYVRGLRLLAEACMEEDKGAKVLRGTTYFVKPRTARRFGFHQKPIQTIQQLLIWFNAAQLTLAYSIVRRRPAFPPLAHIRTFETTAAELWEHRDALLALEERLAD